MQRLAIIGSYAANDDRVVQENTVTGERLTITYDPAGRLVRVIRDGDFAADVRYTYDARGNRLSINRDGVVTTSTYDHDDRLITSGDWRYAYTAHGDLLEKSNIVTGQKLTLTYNERGQLTRAILPNSQVVQYAIDGEGKRFAKTVDGAFVAFYLYDIQGRLVAELEPSGAIKSRFIYATQSHSPDYMIQAGVNLHLSTFQIWNGSNTNRASTKEI